MERPGTLSPTQRRMTEQVELEYVAKPSLWPPVGWAETVILFSPVSGPKYTYVKIFKETL